MDFPNNPDFSPPQEMLSYTDQFDTSYLTDAYSLSPNYSLESFFEQPLTTTESPYDFSSKPLQGSSGPALLATGISAVPSNSANLNLASQHTSEVPFGKLEHFSFGSSFDPRPSEPFGTVTFCPPPISSRTPSLCGDASEKASITLSPHTLKREYPSSPDSVSAERTPKRPQRKRGRPRLERSTTDTVTASSTSSPSSKSQRTSRLPHNQVERKYREGLNSELEKLRQAVPTLPQSDEAGAMGQPKPSKAMVLSSAIEYIKSIEHERDALKAENERLRSAQAGGVVVRNWKIEDESLQDFLTNP